MGIKRREKALSRGRMVAPLPDRGDRLGGVGAGEKGGAAKLVFRSVEFEVLDGLLGGVAGREPE